jgi:hypothetical protein
MSVTLTRDLLHQTVDVNTTCLSLSDRPDSAHPILQQVKLYGTIYGLITVHVLYGFPIISLIFRNYFPNIPDELMEAARIDSAGIIRTLYQRYASPVVT